MLAIQIAAMHLQWHLDLDSCFGTAVKEKSCKSCWPRTADIYVKRISKHKVTYPFLSLTSKFESTVFCCHGFQRVRCHVGKGCMLCICRGITLPGFFFLKGCIDHPSWRVDVFSGESNVSFTIHVGMLGPIHGNRFVCLAGIFKHHC